MNSKQLRHKFSFRFVFFVLVTMFVVVQPGFADDEGAERSWWDRVTAVFQSDSDEKDCDEGDKKGRKDCDKGDEKDCDKRDKKGRKDCDKGDEKDCDKRDKKDRKDCDKDCDKDDEKECDDDDPPPDGVSKDNFIAIHDRNSSQYNDNCSNCHAEIHTRQTLDPSIPAAHIAMLPFAPGEGNNKCVWCHRSVDLIQAAGSPQDTGNSIRKRIDPRLCTLCHGPSGPGKRFYAVDFSAVQLDGADLYGLTCSGCHRPLANSEVSGEDAGDIQEAIAENEGGMGALAVLSVAQIEAIAAALNGQDSPLLPPDGTPPPPAVVANPDSATATQGEATTINVITNDSGTGLNLTAFDSISSQGGTVSCTTAGLCNYTSAIDFTGTDTFSYTISDGTTSDTTIVSVTVSSGTPPPPPPVVANPDSATAIQGVAIEINVLANDTGSGLSIIAFDASSSQGGTVICSATICNYTSAAGFTGTDTFTYTMSDGVTTDTATVTVTVSAATPDGALLYSMHCAACHGAIPNSSKQGASASAIQNAINNNTGGMGSLNFLTPAEVQAISAALQ